MTRSNPEPITTPGAPGQHEVYGTPSWNGQRADVRGVVEIDMHAALCEPDVQATLVAIKNGGHLFYERAMHDVYGLPGRGKTMLAYYAVVDVIKNGGAALLVNFEVRPRDIADRLRSLGLSEAVILDRDRFDPVTLSGTFDEETEDDLRARCACRCPTLVVIDSTSALFFRHGIGDADTTAAGALYLRLKESFTPTSALVCIDHSTWDQERSRQGARGSSGKLQVLDVSYHVTRVESFSRDREGWSKVTVVKDNLGWSTTGETIAEMHVHVPLQIELLSGGATPGPIDAGLMVRVRRLFDDHDTLSSTEVRKLVQVGKTKSDGVLARLEADGIIERPSVRQPWKLIP
jgi:hypothetical protein